jgi:hypothetical protein
MAEKVPDWQMREARCGEIPQPGARSDELVDKLKGIDAHIILLGFVYDPDEADYWQTSCEAQETLAGDCEDVAALILKLCKQAGIDSSIFMVAPPGYDGGLWHHVVSAPPWIIDYFGAGVVAEAHYFAMTGNQVLGSYGG